MCLILFDEPSSMLLLLAPKCSDYISHKAQISQNLFGLSSGFVTYIQRSSYVMVTDDGLNKFWGNFSLLPDVAWTFSIKNCNMPDNLPKQNPAYVVRPDMYLNVMHTQLRVWNSAIFFQISTICWCWDSWQHVFTPNVQSRKVLLSLGKCTQQTVRLKHIATGNKVSAFCYRFVHSIVAQHNDYSESYQHQHHLISSFTSWLQHLGAHSARMAKCSTSMTWKLKYSTNCKQSFRMLWKPCRGMQEGQREVRQGKWCRWDGCWVNQSTYN